MAYLKRKLIVDQDMHYAFYGRFFAGSGVPRVVFTQKLVAMSVSGTWSRSKRCGGSMKLGDSSFAVSHASCKHRQLSQATLPPAVKSTQVVALVQMQKFKRRQML